MYKNKFVIDGIDMINSMLEQTANKINNILNIQLSIKKANELFDYCKDKYINNYKE